MVWKIELSRTAARALGRLDRGDAKRIVSYLRERIETSDDPRRHGRAPKGASRDYWRYRVGDFRLVCSIDDRTVRVLVVRVGHRKEVYRSIP